MGRSIGTQPDDGAGGRQKPRAMRVASRTVCASAGEPDPEERVVTSDAGSTSAQPANASTNEKGMRAIRRSNAVAAVPGVPPAIDPTGEEHAGGHGDVDHVAALQALAAVERNGVEEMLERGVGAEGQQEADQPDHVPGDPLAGRQP